MNKEYYDFVKNQASLLNMSLKEYLSKFAPQFECMVLTSPFYLNDKTEQNYLNSSATYINKQYETEIYPVRKVSTGINHKSEYNDLKNDILPEPPKEYNYECEKLIVKKKKEKYSIWKSLMKIMKK